MRELLIKYLNKRIQKRYDKEVEQVIAEQLKGSLMIEGDKAFRWTRVETGMWFWKSSKLVKIYE